VKDNGTILQFLKQHFQHTAGFQQLEGH